jgi:chromatin remodeling complex protein RSC6
LVQKLWKYIKGNDLQDPADRRFILCDAKLKKIFDQDRINSFGMNKDLSAHLTKKEEPAKEEQVGETTAQDAITTVSNNATVQDTPLSQQEAATSVEEPIVSPKDQDFLLNL